MQLVAQVEAEVAEGGDLRDGCDPFARDFLVVADLEAGQRRAGVGQDGEDFVVEVLVGEVDA